MSDILSFIEFNQYNFPFLLQFLGLYLLILWLAVVAWVLRDITIRSSNLLVTICVTLFVLIGNIPALVIYLLIRPEKTLEEGKTKDLFYASVLDKEVTSCKSCGTLARVEYKFCPNCSAHLQERCHHCGITVNPTWKFCANCQEYLLPVPWYKRLPTLAGIGQRVNLNLPEPKRFELQFPKWDLKRISVNLEQVRKFNKRKKLAVKTIAAKKDRHEVSKRSKEEIVPIPSLSEVKTSFATNKPGSSDQSEVTSSTTKKKRRGRPKGKPDAKPRKKRSDAGKKRGKYKK